jgi:hypothetical protein
MRLKRNFIVFIFAALAFAIPIAGQSADQSSPTPLTTAEFSGKGPAKEAIYYFNFAGGPGEVTIRLEIKAKQYSTFARLEVLDSELSTLATHNMNAATTSGSQQVLKKINLDAKQTVLLKVTLDGNLANYKIAIGGAVEAGATETGASTPTDVPSADTGAGSNSSTDPSPSEASPGPTASTGGNKFFNVDFGKFKVGQFINLPKGTLVIQMKDGSTQEIDLMTVKSVTIKKN